MKSKIQKRNINRVVGLGYFDFQFTLELTDEDILNYSIDLEAVQSAKDLAFLSKNEKLLEKIRLSSNSTVVNMLLYLNKTSKSKVFIEFATLDSAELNKEEEFLKEVITYVTEHNFVFLNELRLCCCLERVGFGIKRNGVLVREFVLGVRSEGSSSNSNTNSGSGSGSNEGNEGEGNKGEGNKGEGNKGEGGEGDGNSNEKAEEDKNNSNSNSNNKPQRNPSEFPNHIHIDFRHFDYFLIDLNVFSKYLTSSSSPSSSSQNIDNSQLDNSQSSQQQQQTQQKPQTASLEEILALLQHITLNHHQIKIITAFPDIQTYYDILTVDNLTILQSILTHTDIFIFEKKDAQSLFTFIHQLSNPNYKEIKGKITDKQLEQLFFESFTSKKKNTKLGVFIDDFARVILVEKTAGTTTLPSNPSNNSTMNNSYPIDLTPRVNHTNQRLVEEYKKTITHHKNLLKSVFMGGFLCKLISHQGIINSVKSSVDITKRILETLRLSLEFPSDPEFYIVSFKKADGKNAIVEKQKEENFVLDCVNVNKSKLSFYNPLKDNNLYSFFSSGVIRRHLAEVGFINTKGFILQDPSKHLSSPLKSGKAYEAEIEKEKKLLIAIKEQERRDKLSVRKNLSHKSRFLHDTKAMELEKLIRNSEVNDKQAVLLPSFDMKGGKLKPIHGYASLMTTNKSFEKGGTNNSTMMDKSKNNTKGSGSNEEMKIRKQDSDAIVDEL